jgi:hypothetical protein
MRSNVVKRAFHALDGNALSAEVRGRDIVIGRLDAAFGGLSMAGGRIIVHSPKNFCADKIKKILLFLYQNEQDLYFYLKYCCALRNDGWIKFTASRSARCKQSKNNGKS